MSLFALWLSKPDEDFAVPWAPICKDVLLAKSFQPKSKTVFAIMGNLFAPVEIYVIWLRAS